jgi:hypothetical protein
MGGCALIPENSNHSTNIAEAKLAAEITITGAIMLGRNMIENNSKIAKP